MKLLKLEELICSLREEYGLDDESEILVADDDGWLHEFKLEYFPEVFDGFDTAYPAGLKIVTTKTDEI